MANEPKRPTDPNRPGQHPSGGSSSQPGQQNPGSRRSDEWSDKGGTSPSNPNDPSRRNDDDVEDMDESENPA
jgi:hypothetical protein